MFICSVMQLAELQRLPGDCQAYMERCGAKHRGALCFDKTAMPPRAECSLSSRWALSLRVCLRLWGNAKHVCRFCASEHTESDLPWSAHAILIRKLKRDFKVSQSSARRRGREHCASNRIPADSSTYTGLAAYNWLSCRCWKHPAI